MINTLRRLFGFYDSNGLKYSSRHLRKIYDNIPFWGREQQAKYVDAVTKYLVDNDNQVIVQSFYKIDRDTWFRSIGINATSIGNLAYISLHHKADNVRAQAEQMLSDHKDYVLAQMQKYVFVKNKE